MRRPAAVLPAVLLTAALSLTACGGAGDPETEGPQSETGAGESRDLATLRAVQVDGEPGSQPTVTFDTPFEVEDYVAYVETEGDGDPLEEGRSASVHWIAFTGDDGEEWGSTWESGQTEEFVIGDPGLIGALTDALEGQQVGARVLFAAPGGEDEVGNVNPALVMVIDVVDVNDAPEIPDIQDLPDRAWGEPVEPVDGLPTVTLDEDGAPTIDVSGAQEPDDLVVQPLLQGDGPEIEVGQLLTIHYHGVLLETGEVFDSSWARGEPAQFPIGQGQLIQGWDEGLPGQNVGSQVLLVIPADQAYGDDDRPSIPGGSTLVFVVDILDAS